MPRTCCNRRASSCGGSSTNSISTATSPRGRAESRFEILNHLKQKRRSRVVFNDALIARLAEIRADRAEVHFADQAALAGCIEELSESDRKLIELCYATKRNIKAAAAALHRPVASVYTSLVRVRRILMECIRQASAEEGRR